MSNPRQQSGDHPENLLPPSVSRSVSDAMQLTRPPMMAQASEQLDIPCTFNIGTRRLLSQEEQNPFELVQLQQCRSVDSVYSYFSSSNPGVIDGTSHQIHGRPSFDLGSPTPTSAPTGPSHLMTRIHSTASASADWSSTNRPSGASVDGSMVMRSGFESDFSTDLAGEAIQKVARSSDLVKE